MSLSKWEEYVKDNKLEPHYDAKSGAYLAATLRTKCNEAYEDIMDQVEGGCLLRSICEGLIDDDKDKAESIVKNVASNALNVHIQYALDAIKDKQSEYYEEDCCITAYKRDRELAQ